MERKEEKKKKKGKESRAGLSYQPLFSKQIRERR